MIFNMRTVKLKNDVGKIDFNFLNLFIGRNYFYYKKHIRF